MTQTYTRHFVTKEKQIMNCKAIKNNRQYKKEEEHFMDLVEEGNS